MKGPVFVRALWGVIDASMGVVSPSLPKVYQDVKDTIERYPVASPTVYYVFGIKNYQHLEQCGIDARMVSPAPLVNWDKSELPRDAESGREAYGLSLWRHKLEVIRMAMEEFGEVIWLDWDTHLIKSLPEEFWVRIRKGHEFQAGLRQYRNPYCGWRTDDQRKLPHGAFLYFSNIDLVRLAIEIHKNVCPKETDETAFAHLVDLMMGGRWLGSDAYFKLGFSPYCYATDKLVLEPRPEDILFVEGSPRHERIATKTVKSEDKA